MDSILNQLIKYHKEFNPEKSSDEDIEAYYIALIKRRNLIYMLDEDGKLMALLEFFLLDRYQAERMINGEMFRARDENTVYGDICYISDIWIRDDHRQNGGFKIIKTLKKRAELLHGKKAEVIMGKNYKRREEGKFKIFKGGG